MSNNNKQCYQLKLNEERVLCSLIINLIYLRVNKDLELSLMKDFFFEY